jgi:hypothetical protein
MSVKKTSRAKKTMKAAAETRRAAKYPELRLEQDHQGRTSNIPVGDLKCILSGMTPKLVRRAARLKDG